MMTFRICDDHLRTIVQKFFNVSSVDGATD